MTKPTFKILSIDGGGIRGIIPCTILAFLESQLGNLNTFDLMAGTSTGGLITLGLSMPNTEGENAFTAQDMLKLYTENGAAIFGKRQQSWLIDLFSQIPTIGQLAQSPFDEKNLEKLLKKYFGDNRLKDQLKHVLITTYDIQQAKPFYFTSRFAQRDEKENFLLREIARSTSAAPTYFEPAMLRYDKENDLVFVDGGVFANNPAVLAYCEAKEIWKHQTNKGFEPEVSPDDHDYPFFMLSLGTGHCQTSISGKEAKKWRTFKWINPMLQDVFMNSVSANTHYAIQHLLPPYTNKTPRYIRLNVDIPKELSAMDNASPDNIKKLCEIAEDYVAKNKNSLLYLCDLLS